MPHPTLSPLNVFTGSYFLFFSLYSLSNCFREDYNTDFSFNLVNFVGEEKLDAKKKSVRCSTMLTNLTAAVSAGDAKIILMKLSLSVLIFFFLSYSVIPGRLIRN